MKHYYGKYNIEVYDSREGEDFKFELSDGSLFSSLENNFSAIDIIQTGIDWSSREITIDRKIDASDCPNIEYFLVNALLKHGGIGFTCLSFLTRVVKKSNLLKFNDVDWIIGSMVGYFELNHAMIQYQIDTRKKLASYEEWGIGCCNSKFQITNDVIASSKELWDFILKQPDKLNCIVYYIGELDRTIIISRIFEGFDEILKNAKMTE